MGPLRFVMRNRPPRLRASAFGLPGCDSLRPSRLRGRDFMKRRDFLMLAGAAGGTAAFRGRAIAQSALRRPLVAYLSINALDARVERFDPFVDAMRNLGWVEGQNYSIEFRSSEGIN